MELIMMVERRPETNHAVNKSQRKFEPLLLFDRFSVYQYIWIICYRRRIKFKVTARITLSEHLIENSPTFPNVYCCDFCIAL